MWPPPSFPTSGGSSQGQGTEQGTGLVGTQLNGLGSCNVWEG